MTTVRGSKFYHMTGIGHVRIIDGDPWVEWLSEDNVQPTLIKARVYTSSSTKSGSRWMIFAPVPGGHNRTVYVPERCIQAAHEEVSADDDN